MQVKQKLHNYAIWYIAKYLPSKARLRQKLQDRSTDAHTIEEVMLEVLVFIDEPFLIRSTIESLIESGLGISQIRTRLLRRGFDRALISEIFEDLRSDTPEYERIPLRTRRIEQMIADGVRKCESKKLIKSKLLVKYREAHEEIDALIELLDDREILQGSYRLDSLSRKDYDRLVRRGFSYRDVSAVFGGNIGQK